MKTLIFSILFISFPNIIFTQSTPQPTVAAGTNNVYFDANANAYIFTFSSNGDTPDLIYKYSLNINDGGGSFKGLTSTVNNSYTFWPSYYGGIAVQLDQLYYSWDAHVTFQLLSQNLLHNKVYTNWKMIIYLDSGPVYYYFDYVMYISGRTLVINTIQDAIQTQNIVCQLNLDRSYSDPSQYYDMNAYNIGIPYLTLFNILFNGNISNPSDNRNVFTSMFFDWTATNASEFVPQNIRNSNTSMYYSQYAKYDSLTDNTTRNPLSEIIYLTVSPELNDVFPNIPNPVSTYRNESINRIIYDYPEGDPDYWNSITPWELDELSGIGITNCWMIVHNWQKDGYDCGYPTDVMPARDEWGGDNGLINVRNKAVNQGYLFSLHEDYWFIQVGVPGYDPSVLSLPLHDWEWCHTGHQSYLQHPIKPTKYNIFYNRVSSKIHSNYNTNSGYLDAFTNAPPSFYVDYDLQVEGAGKFLFTLGKLRQAGLDLQGIHQGPISAEGGSHLLFEGYFDDFEGEIHWAKYDHGNYDEYGGYYKPLIVDFDILKMRDKTFVHGVGYYQRFFADCPDGNFDCGRYQGLKKDSIQIYTATELAYAHGGFFKARYNNDDLLYQAGIQFNYVLPMQSKYSNAGIISILYNDNGTLLTATDYIKKYPNSFDCFLNYDGCDNSNFMGQVRIEYSNHTLVYVNRHPTKNWIVNDIMPGMGWYNYHVNGAEPVADYTGLKSYNLPPENGWVCYSTSGPSQKLTKKLSVKSPFVFKLSQNYPNPFNPVTEINYQIPKNNFVTLKIYNVLGQVILTLVNNEFKKAGDYKISFDGTDLASGVYFYKLTSGNLIDTKKMVLIK